MKSLLYSALALTAALGLSACTDEFICVNGKGPLTETTLDLAPIQGLRVGGSANVYLSEGSTQEIRVRTQENIIPALDFEVIGDALVIDLDGCYHSYDLDVYITLAQPLAEIQVSGSADVRSQGRLTAADTLKLDVSGSGEISLESEAKFVLSSISGAGGISLDGAADSHWADLSGSGDLKAFGFLTTNSYLVVTGATQSEVSVNSGILDVNLSGAGTVTYKGLPSSINTRISGSGRVINGN
jgi:hypothetical protein